MSLQVVQNFYIVSLAVADMAVASLVMPFNVANYVIGQWVFGEIFCNIWLTSDILMCTASILNLCAIAIDRYYAIHDPISYAVKRTFWRVLAGIGLAWILSAIISIPPLLGWNNATGRSLYDAYNRTCQLTDEKSFVIYSASGSFYIPLVIMTFVYIKVFSAARKRLKARANAAAAAKLAAMNNQTGVVAASSSALLVKNGGGVGSCDQTGKTHKPEMDGPTASHAMLEVSSAGSPEEICKDHMLTAEAATGRLLHITTSTSTMPTADSNHTVSSTLTALNESPKPALCTLNEKNRSANNSDSDQPQLSPAKGKQSCNGDRKTLALSSSSTQRQKRTGTMHSFVEERHKISLSKERRAARTMAIIMGAFVACWLPFFLMYVIFPFCPYCVANTSPRAINFIVWLGYVNSALNPVIYTVFNVDFRRSFKRLLGGKCL